jgi:hypothetical protein
VWKWHNGDAGASPKFVLDEFAHGGLDFRLLVERRTPVAHDLLHRRLIADPEAIRSRLAHEIGAILEREGGVVDRRRVQLRLAEGEAELREVRHLVGLPAGGLEQDRGSDAPVDVAQRPLVSASSALLCACSPAMSVSIAATSRDSPSWPSTTLRKPGSASGAEPSVINGSVRAFLNASCAASEIHCASIASVPRVCWY